MFFVFIYWLLGAAQGMGGERGTEDRVLSEPPSPMHFTFCLPLIDMLFHGTALVGLHNAQVSLGVKNGKVGEVDLSGSMTQQETRTLAVNDANPHLVNLGSSFFIKNLFILFFFTLVFILERLAFPCPFFVHAVLCDFHLGLLITDARVLCDDRHDVGGDGDEDSKHD
jgi:hypothetical protein